MSVSAIGSILGGIYAPPGSRPTCGGASLPCCSGSRPCWRCSPLHRTTCRSCCSASRWASPRRASSRSTRSRVQQATEPSMQGRVMALHQMAWFGSTPVGALAMGWVIQTTSPRVPFVLRSDRSARLRSGSRPGSEQAHQPSGRRGLRSRPFTDRGVTDEHGGSLDRRQRVRRAEGVLEPSERGARSCPTRRARSAGDLVFEGGTILGWRDCMVGRLGLRDDEVHTTRPEVMGVFGGYAYLGMTLMRVWAHRTPGFTPEMLDAAYFAGNTRHPALCARGVARRTADHRGHGRVARGGSWVTATRTSSEARSRRRAPRARRTGRPRCALRRSAARARATSMRPDHPRALRPTHQPVRRSVDRSGRVGRGVRRRRAGRPTRCGSSPAWEASTRRHPLRRCGRCRAPCVRAPR